MHKLKELQKKLRALIAEGDALHAKETLTAEETARATAINTEMEQLEAEITAEQRKVDFQERRARLNLPVEQPVERGTDGPAVEDRSDYNRWPREEAGQFFQAVRAMGMSTRRLPAGMNDELRETFTRAITGQGTAVEDEGGWAVPQTIAATILQHMHQEGQVVSRCQNVPITVGNSTKWNVINETDRSATGKGGRYGGITWSRVGEGGSGTASKIYTKQVALELKKLLGLVYLTEEQLEDGPQVMSLITTIVPKAGNFTIEDELINGVGGPNIEGVLRTPSLVTVAKETGQSAGTIVRENIENMWNRLIGSSRSNAAWFINQDAEVQLGRMVLPIGTGGVPVYMPAGGLTTTGFSVLMGRPVIPIEHCAALGTVGDIILADMSQFLYATKGGITTQQSIHVRFLEGETVLRFTLRNDGKGWWSAPLTAAKGGTTRSPFVVLATRA
jgi:HK97 family phage major capsid protein